MSDLALVTGGGGLVGGAVLDHLVAGGQEVRALIRSADAGRRVEERGAEAIMGDVLDPTSLTAALDGVDVCYHLAGINALCLRYPSRMDEVNIAGSVNIVRASAEARVRRLVYTSSAAVLGEPQGTVGSEDSEHRGWFLSRYERSKFESERAVLAESARLGVDTVCVNPSSVQGPGRAHGTGRLLVDYLNGRLKVFVDATVSLVDIRDCARGHVLAANRGETGQRYVLSGFSMTVRELMDLLTGITGVRTRARALPAGVAHPVGWGIERISSLRGRDRAPLCPEMVRTLLHGHIYDGSRATRELGLHYTPAEVTLRDTVAWLVDSGLAPGAAGPR